MIEDYVSFETAKLLKEKGFCEKTEHKIWYVIKQFSTGCHWNSCTYKAGDITREYNDGCCISMPTLQMAMKWLREIHELYIEVSLSCDREDKNAKIFDASIFNIQNQRYKKLSNIQGYEQACEAAIKYCVENLI